MNQEEKFNVLAKGFSDKNELRQKEHHLRLSEKRKYFAEKEQLPYIRSVISEKCSVIEHALDELIAGKFDKNIISQRFDTINANIKDLQQYFATSSMCLKGYEVRKGQITIHNLRQRFQELEKTLLPRKKFEFTSRRCVEQKRESKIQEDLKDDDGILDCNYVKYDTEFSYKKGENLTILDEAINKKDVYIAYLEDCTVELKGAPGLLTIAFLKNCEIFSGPVATSVFIDNCSDCIFVLPCQQLRVHDTKHCDFKIQVTSRVIIEGTTHVRFAPYDWSYDGIGEHFDIAMLNPNINNWNLVDDFNWLASDKPSPNWSILKNSSEVEKDEKNEEDSKRVQSENAS